MRASSLVAPSVTLAAFALASALVLVHCGDGKVDPGEACDDGDVDNTNGCTTTCKFSVVKCEVRRHTVAKSSSWSAGGRSRVSFRRPSVRSAWAPPCAST